MTPIARYPAISWILLAVTAKILIAAASNIQIEPFIKITLQHPCSIVPYLCSRRACSFSPTTSFCAGADGNVYSDAKIFVANHHVLAHSESVILAQPFHSDGDGRPVRDDDNIQATTSNRTCSDVHDRLDHLDDGDFGFLGDILPTSEYNNDHLFGINSSPSVSISVSHTATARSTSPDAHDRPIAAAITDDTTAIAIVADATVAAIVAVKPRNDNAHRASLPLSTGPILSVPERRMRVTARGPPIPARHANDSTGAIPMPTAGVLPPWQVR